jgi:muconolactone delta-isomerase
MKQEKILVILRTVMPLDIKAIEALEAPEAERVWELYQNGVLEEIYLAENKSAAYIMLRVRSFEDAQSAIQSLPMVKAKTLDPSYVVLTAWPEMTRMLNERGRNTPEWSPSR